MRYFVVQPTQTQTCTYIRPFEPERSQPDKNPLTQPATIPDTAPRHTRTEQDTSPSREFVITKTRTKAGWGWLVGFETERGR